MLDDVLPPALGIGLAGGRGERAERVGRRRRAAQQRRSRRRRPARLTASGRSIASTVGAVGERPAHRLPLRAELGERREHGALGLGDDVAEQGDRRHEAGVADPAQRAVGIGRRLDEHDVGLQLVERAHHRARRARAVVADAEQVQPRHRPGRTRTCRQARSRQAS